MNKYIKKPIKVEALQIHGNVFEIKEFIGLEGDVYIDDAAWRAGVGQPRTVVMIHTLEGDMKATDGDYIIKGVKGEFYPCRKDIFEETYELAENELEQNPDWMYSIFDKDKIKAYKERQTKASFKIGDRVKFKTIGGWYNGGIVKDVDDDSCLIEVDTLGYKSPEVYIPLPNYTRVLSYTLIPEQEVES